MAVAWVMSGWNANGSSGVEYGTLGVGERGTSRRRGSRLMQFDILRRESSGGIGVAGTTSLACGRAEATRSEAGRACGSTDAIGTGEMGSEWMSGRAWERCGGRERTECE